MPIIVDTAQPRVIVVKNVGNVGSVVASSTTVRIPDQGASLGRATNTTSVVKVTSPGPQGGKGDPGVSASGLLPAFNFAYGDATPHPLLTVSVDTEVVSVSLEIEVAFDGASPQILLGTAAYPALLMAGWENLPSQVGVYELAPRAELLTGETILLTITPGAGASQGRGQFIINAVPSA